jgi:hypothetical protein
MSLPSSQGYVRACCVVVVDWGVVLGLLDHNCVCPSCACPTCVLQLEATMTRLAARLTQLQELTLIFNNPGQQLETRHLASLAALPALSALTLQGNFHPESCNFTAALGPCSGLAKLVVLPSEASSGLTDCHVASLAGLRGLQALEFPGHARAFTGASLSSLAAALPLLSRLVISSNKPGAVDYTLALPALAGLRALTRRWVGDEGGAVCAHDT